MCRFLLALFFIVPLLSCAQSTNEAALRELRDCESGLPRSCFTYARMLYIGKLIPKDEIAAKRYTVRAFKMAKKGCKLRDKELCHLLGARLLVGTEAGLRADPKQAKRLFDRGCRLGSQRACLVLRQMDIGRTSDFVPVRTGP